MYLLLKSSNLLTMELYLFLTNIFSLKVLQDFGKGSRIVKRNQNQTLASRVFLIALCFSSWNEGNMRVNLENRRLGELLKWKRQQ